MTEKEDRLAAIDRLKRQAQDRVRDLGEILKRRVELERELENTRRSETPQ